MMSFLYLLILLCCFGGNKMSQHIPSCKK
ncbi:hypothetical protein LINPERPRIM_LOCUS466 [Linum perenne]